MNFYNKFLALCDSIGKKPSVVAEEAGLSRSQVTRWKRGQGFTDASAMKLANYFGIDVTELTSERTSGMSIPHTREEFVDIVVPGQDRIEIDQPAEYDELADELQWLKDSPTTRSILKASKGLTEGQLKAIEEIMIQMRGSE